MSPQPDPTCSPPPPPAGREPVFNLPPATLWLTLAIISVFALQNILEGPSWTWLMSSLAFISSDFWPAGSDLPAASGLPSLVTYAFLHGDFMHILLNLGFLLAFGSFVERLVGPLAFLVIFAITAALGALAEFWFRGADVLVLIGASGAVYGMTGAALRFMVSSGIPALRRRALAFAALFMGLNLAFGLSGLGAFLAGAEIGWKAHAAGFLAGVLLSFVFPLRPPPASGLHLRP